MTLGSRLTKLRKENGFSQEEVAEKLNVTRQTVSKWETNGSTPDFDKIMPLCKLYNISSDELLTGEIKEKNTNENNEFKKRTKGIVSGIFLYFISVVWIMISTIPFNLDPVIASAIFLVIAAVATCTIIYSVMTYKKEKKEKEENKLLKQIEEVLALITLIIYFLISFITLAWHLTWIIWIVFALVMEIIKLIFMLKGDKNEK